MWHVTVIYPGNVSEIYDFGKFSDAMIFSNRHNNHGAVSASTPWHDDAEVENQTVRSSLAHHRPAASQRAA